MGTRDADASLLPDAMHDFQRVVHERDAALAARVLHPGFALVLVHPTAAVISRERWLSMLPDYLVSEWSVEESRTDVDGSCAAVLQRVRMRALVLGEDRSGVFVISDVWRHQDAGWQIWRRHSSPLSAGPMPGTS